MRLKRFQATNVHGFLNFSISFNDDLTFLVGVNGSGKTTALRLIHAFLGPYYEEIYSIPFDRLELIFDDAGQERALTATNKSNQISISIDHISPPLDLPPLPPGAADNIASTRQRNESLIDTLRVQHANNPTYDYLSKLDSPFFLGLERRQRSQSDEYDVYARDLERSGLINARTYLGQRKTPKGALGASLSDVQLLVREAYRRLRQVQDRYAADLRQAVLLSAFKYTDFSLAKALEPTFGNAANDLEKLLARRGEIKHALTNIDARGERVTRQLDEFFNRLEHLLSQMKASNEREGFHIEWLTNKAQFDRIEDLISLIDSNKSQVDKLFSPVHLFLQTINFFYADTGKSVEFDAVGTMSILRPDKQKASIEALSSGERQLLVIFGHLFFNRYSSLSNVFIIDEPELSLHLRWQENFVVKALTSNPKLQLILATHSPEIVGAYKTKCVQIVE